MTDPNQREIIVAILEEVLEEGKYSHLVLGATLEKYQYLSKQQRAFITRVTQGTIERLLQIDAILGQFVKKPKVPKMKPLIRTVLRSSVYQIVFMDGVPDAAVCNEAVRIVKNHGLGGLSGFVNGVLRNISRNKDSITYKDLSEAYSMPQWIIDAWEEQFGGETTKQILEELLEEKKTCIRVNTGNISVEELTKNLRAQGITVEPCEEIPYALYISGYDYLRGIPEFLAGDFYIQDFSSMMVAHSAGIQQGDHVIDVCAAPGGKSLHAAELLAGTGLVEARDLSDHKVSLLEENIRRMGLANIRAEKWDATILNEESIGQADVVICDAPCSGLGVVAKKPDIKYHMTKETQKELAILQRQILDVVCAYVKAGGTLMYSTCTISSQENEDNVTWFLEKHPDFSLETEKQFLPKAGKQDGFFLAKMKKR
ncbi:16S rRNA (cytosine(967)-C(5))-methyltransferase RsmB [Roseburia sp. AM51-8]|uniref:16S rRNA (cytosine(967)-C(5))-methyltransferase RsmB n=1 Tax=Roseburia sp. AM51-8 TaxID=2292366 RepID=UPI000E4B5961|nr:16S rRNA (cytosine(967)-C(5))-methyltransferase RsmB [Roseburia sp. AM51-8]RHP99201.1 16S rRNA (cytosine(967)-C(5))-methyltransferase RsmB [Roseburia sp. AM51-8]